MKAISAMLVAFASLAIASVLVCAQPAQTPQSRTVNGQVLTSPELPAVKLKFDKPFKYVGTQSFVLYDVANAEQHFFVDADENGRVRRLYWVQFEGYLPNNTHSYNYRVNKTVSLGGLDFIADAYARNKRASQSRPGSDGSRALVFLESKGLRMESDEIVFQRLVHLIDEAKRNELMIIYIEDLSALGFTAADLAPDGKAAAKWTEVSQRLLDRALKGMQISKL
ncbi:MAG: hypothetical protein AABM67_02460 [Acidobacteriota bacterium]